MSTTTTPSRENQEDRGLSKGYIAAIISGVIAALALLVVLALWYWRRKQRKQQPYKRITTEADFLKFKAKWSRLTAHETTIGRAPEAKTITRIAVNKPEPVIKFVQIGYV